MLENLRLVILDYPKNILENEVARTALSDLLVTKQQSYTRASDVYVSLSPTDMIASHMLVYDQTNPFKPRLVGGTRLSYSHRCELHGLSMPVQQSIDCVTPEAKAKFNEVKTQAVDYSGTFIDAEYTQSKSGLKVMELLTFVNTFFNLQKGYKKWFTPTNEKFKVSRWVLKAGSGMTVNFTHPQVADPHMLIFVENLNYPWLAECGERYRSLIENRFDIFPANYPTAEKFYSAEQTYQFIHEQAHKEIQLAA